MPPRPTSPWPRRVKPRKAKCGNTDALRGAGTTTPCYQLEPLNADAAGSVAAEGASTRGGGHGVALEPHSSDHPPRNECGRAILRSRNAGPALSVAGSLRLIWEGPIGAMRPMSEFDPSQRCWVHEQLNKKTVAGPARRAADASRFSDDVRVDPTTCVH